MTPHHLLTLLTLRLARERADDTPPAESAFGRMISPLALAALIGARATGREIVAALEALRRDGGCRYDEDMQRHEIYIWAPYPAPQPEWAPVGGGALEARLWTGDPMRVARDGGMWIAEVAGRQWRGYTVRHAIDRAGAEIDPALWGLEAPATALQRAC